VHDSYVQSNVERFSGFEDLYDNHRPEAPMTVVEVITSYLERKPGLVVDLGCGTGLSTFVWKDHAERIIGMREGEIVFDGPVSQVTEKTFEDIYGRPIREEDFRGGAE